MQLSSKIYHSEQNKQLKKNAFCMELKKNHTYQLIYI